MYDAMHIHMYAKLNWKHKVQLITLKITVFTYKVSLTVPVLNTSWNPFKTQVHRYFLEVKKTCISRRDISSLFICNLFCSHTYKGAAKKNYSIWQLIITLKELAK